MVYLSLYSCGLSVDTCEYATQDVTPIFSRLLEKDIKKILKLKLHIQI